MPTYRLIAALAISALSFSHGLRAAPVEQLANAGLEAPYTVVSSTNANGLTKRAIKTGQSITLEPIFHGLWTASGGCLLTPHPWSCMTKA
jgi:hypothetical protein